MKQKDVKQVEKLVREVTEVLGMDKKKTTLFITFLLSKFSIGERYSIIGATLSNIMLEVIMRTFEAEMSVNERKVKNVSYIG